MVYSIAVVAGLVAMVAAQVLSSIPACGQTCITNMLSIAQTDFGCASGNATCYCMDPRFGYGLRDCSLQACGEDVYSSVLTYGSSICSSVPPTAAITAATASPTGTAAVNGTSDGTAASGSSTPYSTSAILTTLSSGSSALTTSTVGSSTLFTAIGAASSNASSVSSAVSSVLASATSALSSISSKASAISSASSSATSSGFAAHITAAPMLGGAALAAFFMI